MQNCDAELHFCSKIGVERVRRFNNMDGLITKDRMIASIQGIIDRQYGGDRTKFCKANDISPAYVGEVIRGKQTAGPKFLKATGYQKIELYRKVEE